jgi:DNA-directed RNA polymerase subunit L
MKNRLSQLPIYNIKNTVKILPLKYYKDVNFSELKIERHEDDITNIEYYFKVKNAGPDNIYNVSTDDLKITIDNEQVPNTQIYSKQPILLVQLRPGEEFECSMKAVLAVGEHDTIFNCANVYFEEITNNKYYLMLESFGQISEYDLLLTACDIIIEKLKIIKENLNKNQYQIVITENNSMILEILNEDHTCGGPLNYILQNMSQVLFSGVIKPDFMQKIILIKFKIKDGFKPIEILNIAIDECVKLYQDIHKTINGTLYGKNTKKSVEIKKTKKLKIN